MAYVIVWLVCIIGLAFIVCMFIKGEQPEQEQPPIGTVEIIEIEGKYAVRQFGYYAGYGKPPSMTERGGKEPFMSGAFKYKGEPIRIPKKPEWDFLEKHGCSNGTLGVSSTPSYANQLFDKLEDAEYVADIARRSANTQLEKEHQRQERCDEYKRRIEERKKLVKEANVLKRL